MKIFDINNILAMIASILILQTGFAMEHLREDGNEKTAKGFDVFPPVTLVAKRREALQAVQKRLGSFAQFAAAFVFDEINLTIEIRLPHVLVMNILEGHNLFIDCDYCGWSSKLCDITQHLKCSHSPERRRSHDIHDAWLKNNEMSPKKVEWKIAAPEKFNNFDEIFDYVFNQNCCNGLIFAEDHIDYMCQTYLVYLLPTLVKDYGVEALICELPSQLQPLIDQYFSSLDEELPSELSSCLICLDQWKTLIENNSAPTITDVIKAAKKADIKSVKAADTIIKHFAGPNSALERNVTFNQFLPLCYDPNLRSVIFCGLAHATNYRLKKNLQKCVYGLREIFGFPVLHIFSILSKPNHGEEGNYFIKDPEFKEISSEDADVQHLQADFEVFKLLTNDTSHKICKVCL